MHDFSNIIGNEKAIEYLKKIIKIDKVPHAFIVDGEKGLGKKLISNTFAKTLECEKGGINPCNKCISCVTFESQNHTDLFYINTKDKKTIGVDRIREEINKEINIKPYKHKYKIFIIENADKMTIQAQNALLKTIEEPPSYGIFILLSENFNSFLPTIISRCVILKLNPVKVEDVKKLLIEQKNIDEKQSEIASTFGRGNVGRTLLLLEDEDFVSMKEKIISILIDLKEKDIVEVFNLFNELEIYKDKIDDVLEIIYFWYRDLLVYKETENENYIFDKNSINLIKRNSQDYTLKTLYKNLEEVDKAKYNLKYNGNFQLTMEVMLLNIKE